MSTSNLSKPRIYIQNTGTESISNVTYNYYFQSENSIAPVLEDYYTPNEDIALISDGGSYYHVKYTVSGSIAAGQTLPNSSGNSIGLHYNTWGTFDKTNDYSNNLKSSMTENQKITVYVNDTKIYGTEPSYGGSGGVTGSDLPMSVDLQNFALYSLEKTHVADSSQFIGGGAVGSNTLVEVNSTAKVYGNVVSGGNVTLHTTSEIYGDVLANGSVNRDTAVKVTGTVTESAGVGTISIPTLTVTAGTTDKTFSSGSNTLLPGQYRNLVVQGNATLHFLPGIYTFNNFTLQPDAHIIFDVAMAQNLEIKAAGEFIVSDRATMQFATTGYAPSVKIYTNDPNTISIGVNSKIAGLLYAPYALVSVYSYTQCNGAIYAKQIKIEPYAIVTSSLVDLDGDADNDGVPNYIEVKNGTDPLDSLSFNMVAIPHPVIVDNAKNQLVTYDISRFYTEYKDDETVQIGFNAGTLETGNDNVPLKVSNKPVDYNGGALPAITLPEGYSLASRFFSFKRGTFKQNKIIDMVIPVSTNDFLLKNYEMLYFTEGGIDWLFTNTISATTEKGNVTVAAKMVRPVTGVLIVKNSDVTAYLDEGMVFVNEMQQAELAVSFKITNVTGNAFGSYSIEYTDMANPLNPVNKTYTKEFVNSQTGISSNCELTAETPYQEIVSSGKIVVNKVVITTNTGVNYTWLCNQTIRPGEKIVLQSKARDYFYKNGKEPIAALHSTGFALESIDIDGEGRAKYNSDKTDFIYDFYLKDHLGSTREVLNSEGNISEATHYFPYGMMFKFKEPSPGDNSRLKFTGKEYDNDSANISVGNSKCYDFQLKIDIPADKSYSGIVRYTFNNGYKLEANFVNDGLGFHSGYSGNFDGPYNNVEFSNIDKVQIVLTNNNNESDVIDYTLDNLSIYTLQTGYTRAINLDATLDEVAAAAQNRTNLYTTTFDVREPPVWKSIAMYYFGARYYDPVLGIWGSIDPKEQFYNPYAYAANPVLFIDPDGQEFALGAAIVAACIASAVTTVAVTIQADQEGWHFDQWFYNMVWQSNLSGAIAFVSGGLGSAISAGISEAIDYGIIGDAIGGAASGAFSAATSYSMDYAGQMAFGDKEWDSRQFWSGLGTKTLSGAGTGGAIAGLMSAGKYLWNNSGGTWFSEEGESGANPKRKPEGFQKGTLGEKAMLDDFLPYHDGWEKEHPDGESAALYKVMRKANGEYYAKRLACGQYKGKTDNKLDYQNFFGKKPDYHIHSHPCTNFFSDVDKVRTLMPNLKAGIGTYLLGGDDKLYLMDKRLLNIQIEF